MNVINGQNVPKIYFNGRVCVEHWCFGSYLYSCGF